MPISVVVYKIFINQGIKGEKMSKNNFGIKSTFDAFVALNEILEEEKPSLKKKLKNKNLREGVSVDLRSNDELEAAKKIRAEKKDDTTLEVIDVDADAVDQIQNNDSYVGKMLLQCVSCKATRFVDIDDLKQDENDKDLYNLEDECPHCHHKGSGYSLVGQVGKTPDQEEEEATVDNDEASTEEAVFDNTEDVENEEAEEETPEETPTEEKPEEDEEEKDFTETDSEDDTNDLDLADLGDEFNVDDIVADDTEDEDEEDKTKKESLKEDLFTMTPEYIFKVGDTFTTPIDFEDDAFVADTVYTIVDLGNGKYGIEYENLNYPYVSGGSGIVDIFEEDSLEELSRQIFDYDPHISMEMINRFDPYASYHYGENNEEDEKTMASEFDKYKTEELEEDIEISKADYDKFLSSKLNGKPILGHKLKNENGRYFWLGSEESLKAAHKYFEPINIKDIKENLDMSTFEGSIANLIDTFTIEDHPVNVKLLNKNGSELGIYSSDDLPFTIKSQMMDTFNTDDNFLELNVTEEGEGTTVNDLFNYYRPDEDNQTTFLVTDIDTEEEDEYEELSELLENYGDYYIDGALGLRTLNIYIADGDLETEVEPLDDEEIEELGKENAEKETVTDESLVEEIIKSYPRLKLSRVNNPLSEEYFIAESIRLNEDLDLVYNNFVKHSNNKKLIEHFKSYTGYEDEVDKFLKEHNISKEKYNKIINESADKTYTINGIDYILYKDSYGNYKLDDKKTRERVADWDSYDEAMSDIKKWIKANKITDPTDEINEEAKTGKFIYDDISKFDIELPVEPCKVVLVNQGAYDLEQKGKSGHFTWVTYVHPGKYGKSQKKMDPIIEDVANQIADMYKEKYGKEAIVEDHIDSLDMFRVYIEDDKEDVKEKLFASVKDRAQLGEAINKLVKANEKYRIAKSITEGYRYDIFVNKNCKLTEGLFDLASTDNSNVEEIDAEVVDSEEPEATTTQLVPEGMSEEDVEIVNKIDRIAEDICNAIEEVYNIPAREKKPYVAADIIRDLQLVGGEVLADDLEDTPWNNLTKEMYNQFNGFYDSLDDLVSFVTGQRVTTSQAERLRQAIASLDGPQFTTEAIRANIASPRFLDAVRRGYVPYVSPQEISTNGNNRNNRNRFLEQCDDEITEDVNPKLVDMDGDVEDPNFNLASFAKTTVTESAKDFQEFGNAEDVEKRLDELEYLKAQRELNDEEQEEYEYCLQLLGKEYEKEEYPIDLEEFDSGINEYFADSDDVLGYTSKKIRKDGNDFIVEGLVENWDTSKPVTFIIKKNEGKDNYTVSNDLFEDKFTLDL